MKKVTLGAEASMKDMLRAIKDNASQWRALHINMAAFENITSSRAASSTVFNILYSHLQYDDGELFRCEDGDIFVLCRGVPARRLEAIREQIEYLFSNDDDMSNMAETNGTCLYDVGIAWKKLYKMADKKFDEISHESTKNDHDNVHVETTPILVNQDQASTDIVKAPPQFTIMIVEDDPLSLRMLEGLLQKDYNVITANTGMEAVENYIAHQPDLVFLDIGLPDCDGHQVLENITDHDAEANIVMLSGYTYKQDIMKSMKSGARGFIGKPFCQSKLSHYIESSPTYGCY